MNRSVLRLGLRVLLTALFCSMGTFAYAQGVTSQTLSGTVADASGAVIPGADVAAKHGGTGVVSHAVTNSEGVFSIPSLPGGTYQVTVTLQGFKTIIINDVVITAGAGANVKAKLEVGGVSEQVTVSSSSEIVQTQSSTVSQTINMNQVTKLPLTSRSAMDFVNMLPGVTSPNGNRNAVINGLPRGTINITLDGVNIQDNTLRSTDGFFAIVSPRLDAIEEVTVQSAAQGADAGGQGAVQVKFVTRSGTNNFTGSGYEYFRGDRYNANTWFNNRAGVPTPKLKQNQFGFRTGGPIMLPKFDGHNKAFFFVNYEEFHQPSGQPRDRTILNPAAQNGTFAYLVNGSPVSVNVLALAAANGQISSQDPTISKLLGDIRSATGQSGTIADIDVNLQRYSWNVPVNSMRRYPTFSVDYNLSDKHRIRTAYNYQKFTDFPDTLNSFDLSFPGFPENSGQSSVRAAISNSLRSTLTRNLVNEATGGFSWAPVSFFPELNVGMFNGSIANTQGFSLTFPSVGSNLTSAGAAPQPQSRDATALNIEDKVTWLKGAHSFTMGGAFSQYSVWLKNSNLVPRAITGLLSNDPANALFSAANFPGASSANLTAAGNLYAFLTGRITQITADARLDDSGKYVYEGVGIQRGALRETGAYIQDQWRLRPNVTINAGARYDIQSPFSPNNSSYTFADMANLCGVSGTASGNACNLFQPSNQPGVHTVFQQLKTGTPAYKVDYNNVAPTVGAAWTPQARPGFIGKLMGEADFVVRAGYQRSFSRPGLNDFSGIFGANPGVTISTTRSEGNNPPNLINGGSVPLLFRDAPRLGPTSFAETPTYPMTTPITSSVNAIDPNIRVPYADSWQAGITRSLGKSMALEIRYVGTRGYEGWASPNYNEFDITKNGFLQEFKTAQANLQANIAAGRTPTFAYTGVPGTNPLPIFLAHYNAQPAANAGNAALYTGANWTNSTFLGFLAPLNPNPFGFASTNTTNGLLGNAGFRSSALAAGLPQNFFVVNPDQLGGAFLEQNLLKTNYNSLQIELRRRLSQGLQFQTSYVFGHAYNSVFNSFSRPQRNLRLTGDPGDITHQIKGNVVYDLPFGRGRHWGGNVNGLMDRVIGGWQISVASKVQSGRLVDLGNIRLVGMSKADVQKIFKLRFDDAGKQLYMWPDDVVQNSLLAFNVSATTASGYSGTSPTGRYFAPANGPDCIETVNGYGDCGTGSLVVTGPLFQQHDISFSKQTRVVGHTNFEFRAEMLNAFNHPNFTPISGVGSTTIPGYQLSGLSGTNTFRVIQLVARFNW